MAAPADKDMQPKQNSNYTGFVFYTAFITFGAFCLVNLYVGVIFDQFSKIRLMSQTGSAFLTDKQQVTYTPANYSHTACTALQLAWPFGIQSTAAVGSGYTWSAHSEVGASCQEP